MLLSHLISRAQSQLEKELPFVLYKKPKEGFLNAIFQADSTLSHIVDYSERGFVFAPFLNDNLPVLIKPDEVFQAILEASSVTNRKWNKDFPIPADEQERYTNLVRKAISEIKSGNCKKIVLSRSFNVPLTKPVLVVFQELFNLYSNAFCYLWYHPKVGLWLGATPEILIKTKGLNFTTMSLAGTQNVHNSEALPDWSPKELEEQQLVTDYIAEVLADRAQELHIGEVQTVRAGHLWHLRSKITGNFEKGRLQDLISALHPTPAVCGLPLKESQSFVLENEGYERAYYTGFLGELNIRAQRSRNRNRRNVENSAYRAVFDASELFVNLRCMQKVNDAMTIYVGGGITANSEPKSEWSETESKAQTMLRLLGT